MKDVTGAVSLVQEPLQTAHSVFQVSSLMEWSVIPVQEIVKDATTQQHAKNAEKDSH